MVLYHPHFTAKMTEVEIIEMSKVTEPAHDLGLDESTVEHKLFLMEQIFHTLIAYMNVGMEWKHMCMYICTYVWLRLLNTISFPSHHLLSYLLSSASTLGCSTAMRGPNTPLWNTAWKN